ncbi:hypothetical protein EDM00_07045 [Ornithobacterium rhinotracheale]|nr:hypothetical protein [Ornithobacterium rhinotracheale]
MKKKVIIKFSQSKNKIDLSCFFSSPPLEKGWRFFMPNDFGIKNVTLYIEKIKLKYEPKYFNSRHF